MLRAARFALCLCVLNASWAAALGRPSRSPNEGRHNGAPAPLGRAAVHPAKARSSALCAAGAGAGHAARWTRRRGRNVRYRNLFQHHPRSVLPAQRGRAAAVPAVVCVRPSAAVVPFVAAAPPEHPPA